MSIGLRRVEVALTVNMTSALQSRAISFLRAVSRTGSYAFYIEEQVLKFCKPNSYINDLISKTRYVLRHL